MKGIILAGGSGTRLYLLSLGGTPLAHRSGMGAGRLGNYGPAALSLGRSASGSGARQSGLAGDGAGDDDGSRGRR